MPSKQNTKAIEAWQKENVDRILIKPRKKEHFPERIQLAIEKGAARSRQAYILNAIRKALEEDGIPELGE